MRFHTLDLPVPPMMIQTLVENGIKHGLAHRRQGGMLEILSRRQGAFHELIIANSGFFQEGSREQPGFGIKSTMNRLSILFGPQADFQIRQGGEERVEARVLIPWRSTDAG